MHAVFYECADIPRVLFLLTFKTNTVNGAKLTK